MTATDNLKRFVKRRLVLRHLERNLRRLRRSSRLSHGRLSERYWDCDVTVDGLLSIGGMNVRDLVREHGTPLHVVNFARLKRDHDAFLAAFRCHYENTVLGTSYKTNPVPGVLQELHRLGTLAEVISEFELWLALKLGMPGERILFNGPGKPRSAIELAVDNRVRAINADSLEELELIEEVCAARNVRQRVGLRVTSSVGWQSQFGMNIATGQADRAAALVQAMPHVELVGLHLHLGNGIANADVYVNGVREVVEFALRLERRLGVAFEFLDLGGGFGVPTVRKLDEWDLRAESLGYASRRPVPEDAAGAEAFARAIFASAGPSLGSFRRPVQLVFEPGRAITSQSQILLLSVMRTKTLGSGERAAILDGGRNITMPLGWEYHEILPATKMSMAETAKQSLFGPLCHPGDVVGLHRDLPPLDVGDVITIMDAGAYFVPNQTNFSNPRPAIVGVRDGSATVLRKRERFEDIVSNDC
jgi:diaminopimelate decarboxylase